MSDTRQYIAWTNLARVSGVDWDSVTDGFRQMPISNDQILECSDTGEYPLDHRLLEVLIAEGLVTSEGKPNVAHFLAWIRHGRLASEFPFPRRVLMGPAYQLDHLGCHSTEDVRPYVREAKEWDIEAAANDAAKPAEPFGLTGKRDVDLAKLFSTCFTGNRSGLMSFLQALPEGRRVANSAQGESVENLAASAAEKCFLHGQALPALDALLERFPANQVQIEDVRILVAGPPGGSEWLSRRCQLDWSGRDRKVLALHASLGSAFYYETVVAPVLVTLGIHPSLVLSWETRSLYWKEVMNAAAAKGLLRQVVEEAQRGMGHKEAHREFAVFLK